MLRGKYRIPFYMSTDCENLLKRFLVLNPGKRGTLEVRTCQPLVARQSARTVTHQEVDSDWLLICPL